MKFAVLVATYGDEEWNRAGQATTNTLRSDGNTPVYRYHAREGTLAEARNFVGNMALPSKPDYLIFCDGDDCLWPGYLDAMKAVAEKEPGALIVPRVSYVTHRGMQAPKYWPQVDLRDGNWLIIGTGIPVEQWRKHQFADGIEMYEDWHLFARMVRDGASIARAPDAVYHAVLRPNSRNHQGNQRTKLYWHQWIGHDIFPDSYEPTTHSEDRRRKLMTSSLRRIP